jgi:hypothetical protein
VGRSPEHGGGDAITVRLVLAAVLSTFSKEHILVLTVL